MQTIVIRRFKCLLCGTCAESSSPNPRDSAYCKCQAVWLDGGISVGASIHGDPKQMKDLSVYRAEQK